MLKLLNNDYKYIAIEGNIGVGKTTLAKFLSKEFNGSILLEEFTDNKFLKEFYKSGNYSFQMEMYIRILGPIDVLEYQEEVEQQHVSSNSGSSSTYSSFSSPYTNYYYDTK